MSKQLKKATHEIQDYTAVIPKIQNIYPVEELKKMGWTFEFKYESGIFEYFNYKTKCEGEFDRLKLIAAIDNYYINS